MVDEGTDYQKAQVLNPLTQLNEGSEYLENQREALSRSWKSFHGKVVTFYEAGPIKSAKEVRRYHTGSPALYFPVREDRGAYKADSNSWRRGRSGGKIAKSKWCSDCPLSSICLRNLDIRSALVTRIW